MSAMILPDVQTAKTEKIAAPVRRKHGYLFLKRLVDIVLSLIGLAFSILPMLIISLVIMLESPGPAVYLHDRIGKNGKPLRLLKFRSMYAHADEMIKDFTPEQRAEWEENFKLKNDPRITKVGKFLRRTSLDELPQLVNILKGDISIVGPRPVVQRELEKYGDMQDLLLSVTPGLTGYWQAYARSSCSYEQRIEMELHYARNANFWWDVKIFFATFGAVIRGDGAQ